MASGNQQAAKRRVLVTLELETDLPVKDLRQAFAKGSFHGVPPNSPGYTIKQAQFNVVKAGKKR